jgi:hypothetical protein
MSEEAPILQLRVRPRAREAGLLGRHGEALKVAVRSAPERGRANAELLQLLAQLLALPAKSLELVAGSGSQDKRVRVHGVDAAELRRRVAAALGERL